VTGFTRKREVPSAAIIYILYMKEERISLERPKETYELTFTSGSLFITFLILASGSGG
jgi:hypothetical protein